MRKFASAAALSLFIIVASALPTLAAPVALQAIPQPVRTASPRDFNTLAPGGDLAKDAVEADSAILIDSRTGKVLYEKNADKRQYPASITKIMTCLLALEKGKLSDLITIDEVPNMEDGATTMYLAKGETITLENLVYGLMLRSGNDAAIVIAKHLAGSVENFADMMNDKAAELGMDNTHYVNPHGLHSEEQYTTARDMATLAMAARKLSPEFAKVVSTPRYTIPATNKSEARSYKNSNLLISTSESEIYAYKYATGIKTGYTNAAKHTLVSSAQQDELQLVAVVLRDEKLAKWTDSITMFEYGFQFFDSVDLSQYVNSLSLSADVLNVAADDTGNGKLELHVVPDGSAYITGPKDETDAIKENPDLIEHTVKLRPNLSAPIKKDEEVGTIVFSYDGQDVFTCKLLASRDINTAGQQQTPTAPGNSSSGGKQPHSDTDKALLRIILWVLGILFLLVAAAIVVRMMNMKKRSRRNSQYNYRYRTGRRRRR